MVETFTAHITPFGLDRNTFVYLPDGWQTSGKRYPVVVASENVEEPHDMTVRLKSREEAMRFYEAVRSCEPMVFKTLYGFVFHGVAKASFTPPNAPTKIPTAMYTMNTSSATLWNGTKVMKLSVTDATSFPVTRL